MRDLMVLAAQMGQQYAREAMIDTCVVTRTDFNSPVDELTGLRPAVTVYSGMAKSQARDAYEQNPEAGGHTFTVQRYRADFPVGAFVPQVGDVIEWTDCPLDPDMVGVRERVTAPFGKTFKTAMRLPVERVAD